MNASPTNGTGAHEVQTLSSHSRLTAEHVAITREQLAAYRRFREQQAKLREQQQGCEIDLRHAEYLTSEQKDATLTRYSDVTRELNAVTRQMNELERDEQLREVLEREEQRKSARSTTTESGSQDALRQEVPRPLRRLLPEPESFPVAALATLADVASLLSKTIQAPLALCAQSTLAAATLAVQSYRNIVLDGRTIPLSEYFLSVGESGERKTAVDTEVLRPHREYERVLSEQYTAENLSYENDVAAYNKAKDEALRKAKTRLEKKQALDDLGAPPPAPLLPLLLVQEPSYEGLVKMLLRGQPGVGLFADEAGRMIGGYAMSEEQQLKTAAGLSEFWDGKTVSRVRSGDGAVLLRGRRLSSHLMMQPGVAQRLLGNTLLIEQGYLSRCLTAWPISTAGTRKYREVNLRTEPVMRQYEERILAILTTPLALAEGKENELDPPPLLLSDSAKKLWVRFYDSIEEQLAESAPLAPIRGFANKVPEHALRLAGGLTVYSNLNAKEISAENIGSGIALAQHYLSEALRLFHANMTDPDLLLAEKLLVWSQQRSSHIALADIYQRGPNSIRDVATARKLAAILVAHGWFVPVAGGMEINGQFRRDVWEVNR